MHAPSIESRLYSLVEQTKLCLSTGNFPDARLCFDKAAKLMGEGDADTRKKVSAIYVSAILLFMECNHLDAQDLLPALLVENWSSYDRKS